MGEPAPRFKRILSPFAQIAAAVPATALFPVIVLFVIRLTGGMNLASILLILTGMQWYLLFNLMSRPDLVHPAEAAQTMFCNDKDFVSTRVSYELNLRGPSINVQTACSTSLVAVHLACQAILAGQCEMALAGAATVRVPQRVGYTSVKGGILSPDGHCRAFDADAQGTIFGSGVGAILLKDLAAARTDGRNFLRDSRCWRQRLAYFRHRALERSVDRGSDRRGSAVDNLHGTRDRDTG